MISALITGLVLADLFLLGVCLYFWAAILRLKLKALQRSAPSEPLGKDKFSLKVDIDTSDFMKELGITMDEIQRLKSSIKEVEMAPVIRGLPKVLKKKAKKK